jgi:hypothetical protein
MLFCVFRAKKCHFTKLTFGCRLKDSVLKRFAKTHRKLRTRRRMSSQNGRFPLYVKQGEFKVGVVPADGLGRLLPKTIFGRFDRPACHSPSSS